MELKAEYPYKQGRTPKSDVKACKNVEKRNNLKIEKYELQEKLNKVTAELNALEYYKKKIKKIFKYKTLKTSMKKFNELMDEIEEMPQIIVTFLKKLQKKIESALEFTKDKNIPKTNNLIELFYKVTFPGKIKRIYRTLEGAMNRIRLNNIRWMEHNVIEKYKNLC